MADEYLIQRQTLEDIAGAIRSKGLDAQEMTDIIPLSEIENRIMDMMDLQFFVTTTKDSVDEHSTSLIQRYKNRFHNTPNGYLVITNKISPEIELYKCNKLGTESIDEKLVKFTPYNVVGDSDGSLAFGLTTSHGYIQINSEIVTILTSEANQQFPANVYGCMQIPAVGVTGELLYSGVAQTEGSTFLTTIDNSDGKYKYLYLEDCLAYRQQDYYINTLNQHYIISEDRPNPEEGLLWIKQGKSAIAEIPVFFKMPILYNSQGDGVVSQPSRHKNNIYIKPVDAMWCIADDTAESGFSWRRPSEAVIVKQNEILSFLNTEIEENNDIIADLIDKRSPSAAGEFIADPIFINNDKISGICNYGFYSNQNIGAITAPRCDYIGSYAFTSCTNLLTAVFDGCGQIYTSAFAGCVNLLHAWFPNCSSVTGGSACFTGATSINTVAYGLSGTLPAAHPFKKAAANIKSFYLPYCTSMASACLAGHTKLEEFIAPNLATASTNAFSQCTSLSRVILGIPSILTNANHRLTTTRACLQSIYFPNCTELSNYTTSTSGAFYNYSKLQYASFPMCSTIGGYAFNKCVNLTSLVLNGSQFCNLTNSNAFNSTPIGGYSTTAGTYGSIYVPASMVSLYKTEATWSNFADRITSIENMPDGVLDADKWWENFEVDENLNMPEKT